MENNVFNNPKITNLYNENFVNAVFYGQINYTSLSTKKLKIKQYPYILYFDPNTESGYSMTGGRTEEQIYAYGKKIANEFKLLNVIKHRINNINDRTKASNYKISDNDGRYTIGVQGRRLMYGYPFPNSTSHFVVSANDKKASNSPRFLIGRDLLIRDHLRKKTFFGKLFGFIKKKKKKKIKLKSYKDVNYLNDTLLISFDKNNSMHSKISYKFNGLKITQKLSPLNKDLDEVNKNDTTRYYKIDYIVENETNRNIDAGLLVLFDMMIDKNDAAQMDVFKSVQTKKISPTRKRKNKKLRGKYAKYFKDDKIKRILVYRNKKLSRDLTADFRIITEPDEIHIGSWPTFYSVLWEIPKINIGKKYYDSAVILKWDTKKFRPHSKQYYTTVFGLYNKGNLEIIPAGTNYTGTDTSGRHIAIIKPKLSVTPDTIYEGESALLEWKTKNPTNADVYISAKPATKQRNRGKIVVKTKTTTTYRLQMLDNGKEIANTQASLVVLKRPEKEKINIDGRFSIGTKKTPITFGFPFPYSTSYFQLKYNENFYSNNNKLDSTRHLQGKQHADLKKENKNILTYETDNFEIIQKIIPLDKKYKKTELKNAIYFKCEFSIKNLLENKSKFDFKQILDLSSFLADSLILKINNKSSKFNLTYTGKNVPKKVVLSDYSSKFGVKLYAVLKESERPKSISIGDWHFLKKLIIKTKYSDSTFYKNPTVLLRWTKNIAGNENVKFSYIIGTNENLKIKYNYNQSEQTKSLTVNFKTNKHKIRNNKINEIISFIKNNEFDFIILEGFTDNRGTLEANYQLAKKRINNIKHVIISKTATDKNKILDKVHGEFFSNIKNKNEEVDDSDERKVKILLFKINQ